MIKQYALAAALVAGALSSTQAHAATFAFELTGGGVSGSIVLTYGPNPNTGVLPQTSPNPVDPIGSYVITGASGTFADTAIGIGSTAITGVVASNPANPTPGNLLAPHSFGFFPILSGVPTPEGGIAPGLSYDNLFYPGGSPQAASDYPFHGGVFDIYGMVFTLADGNAVNLWSNGYIGPSLTYGIGVTDGVDVLDYNGAVALTAVPEPATWGLMIGGFAMIGLGMRRRPRSLAA